MEDSKIALIDCDAEARSALPLILPEIERIIAEYVNSNYQGERVLQLFRLEKADLFYRGLQNIAPIMNASSGTIGWTTLGVSTGMGINTDSGNRALDYNPRKAKSYGEKFVAVLGQRPFHDCTAEPGNPLSDNDRRGARQVNLLIQMLGNQMDLKELNCQLFYNLFKSGTTVGFARTITDGDRFGYYEVPNLIPHQECMTCGIVMQSGWGDDGSAPDLNAACPNCGGSGAITAMPHPGNPVHRFPRSSVDLDLLNGYTITWPFNVTDLNKKGSPWIVNSNERNWGEILRDHPQAREIVGMSVGNYGTGSDASETTAAVARSAAQSQTGTATAQNVNQKTEQTIWLDPSQFTLIKDDQTRALCMKLYPAGIRAVKVAGYIIELRKDNYKARLSTCKPSVSDYLFTDGTSWAMFGLEDASSNLLNIAMETLETGVMRFIVNEEYVSADDLNRMRYSPNRFISAIAKFGENISSNALASIPTSDFPQQISGMFEVLEGNIQNVLGLLPQVYGEMPGNLTLGQARMMLNQGLMQLGVPAIMATKFWERSWTNLVNLYVATVTANPTFQGQEIDVDLIRSTQWTIKGDTAMPRSYAERVESLRELLQNPPVAQALKITDPVNLSRVRDYLDLPDLEDPDVDAAEAMNELIDQLWNSAPIMPPPGPPDPMTGMPTPSNQPPQPSIQFDSVLYDPNMAVSLCRASLLKCMLKPTQQRNESAPGYANVRAFLGQAQMAAAPPPPPLPPPKLNISMKIPDATPDQEGAVLNDFGVTVPPPSGLAPPPPQPAQGGGSPQGPPPSSGPPPQQSGPPQLTQPGGAPPIPPPSTSAMNPNPGMIQ
jgi:hypothetical protein